MIYKSDFEAWRKSHEPRPEVAGLMHFHRCSDALYRDIRNFLREICRRRVECGQRQIRIIPSQSLIESCFLFCDEMDTAYMHPRSTSARFTFFNYFPPC